MTGAEADRLADEAVWMSVRVAETTTLLTTAVYCAWLEAATAPAQAVNDAKEAQQEQRARTARLVGGGVSSGLAAQGTTGPRDT